MIAKALGGKWSPYLAAPVFVFIFGLSFYLLDSRIGVSEGYQIISDYCRESIEDRAIREWPPFVWQTGFLLGVLVGGILASFTGGSWKFSFFPEDRKAKGIFASIWITPFQGIVGGFLVMTGLLIAGDSFLGLWAGAMQLSTASWIFIFSLLVWGVVFNGLLRASYTAPSVQKEGEAKEGEKKK